MSRRAGVAAGATAMLLGVAVGAQTMGQLDGGTLRRHQPEVTYVAEPQVVAAGRQGTVEVQMEVAAGFHVNSHLPKSEFLIPTVLQLKPAKDVEVGAVEYPAGRSYTLAGDASQVLDVYTGTVMLRVPVRAAAGPHMLEGTLRYQACDRAACYPPKSVPVTVVFTAQ